jgi:prepilin-type N-terminal cleavage/methylation domain-containing protein
MKQYLYIQSHEQKRACLDRGFTLVEALVAIAILMIAMSSAMTTVSRGLATASHMRNEITSFYLAIDAIEHIRYVRDTNILNGADWLAGFPNGCLVASSACRVDSISSTLSTCGAGCGQLRYDASTGYYGYNATWQPTRFIREIYIERMPTNEEIRVTVVVKWSDSVASNKSVRMVENLTNWQF